MHRQRDLNFQDYATHEALEQKLPASIKSSRELFRTRKFARRWTHPAKLAKLDQAKLDSFERLSARVERELVD